MRLSATQRLMTYADVQEMLASLGDFMDTESESTSVQASTSTTADTFTTVSRYSCQTDTIGQHLSQRNPSQGNRTIAAANATALEENIKELVATEKSYVERIRTLKYEYADPLRAFARKKETFIMPAYEANTLFGNIDNLVPVNEAFYKDLERMSEPGGPGVGDVALKHFKILRGFEQYKMYYSKREEAQRIFETQAKKNSSFVAYMDVSNRSSNTGYVTSYPRSARSTPTQKSETVSVSVSCSWSPFSASRGTRSCSDS